MEIVNLFESTKKAFATLQKQGKQRYPMALKRDAVKLLSEYSTQQLSKALGVTPQSLNNWANAKSTTVQNASPPQAFVALTLPQEETAKVAEPISANSNSNLNLKPTSQLVLQLPHQLQLILPEKSLTKTAKLIYSIIREFDQCSI